MIQLSADASRVTVKFAEISAGVRFSVLQAVNAALIELQGYIRREKLHGQVLSARTGNLSRAITVSPAQDDGARIIGSIGVDRTAPYGIFHEYGVSHQWTIKAKHGGALAFMAGGELVFAKSVTHPGLKERSFMRSSLEDKRVEIVARIQAAVRQGVRGEQ